MISDSSTGTSNKIRVLFVSHSPHFYGAEQSFCFLLENIDREKIEPIVVLPPCPGGFNDVLYQRMTGQGIRTHIVDSRLWLDFADARALPARMFSELSVIGQYVKLIQEEAIDLVYTNTITKIAGAIAARLSGIPHVYHVREVLKDHPLNSPLSDQTTFRIIGALSDRIITNSRAVALQFQGICAPGKITPVYNAVDTSCFEAACQEENRLKQELSLPPEVPLIGIIGTVHRHKNHEELIRAVSILKERAVPGHLVIIGYRIEDYAQHLESLIASLDIAQYVHFLDFRDDIPQVYHDLDLLVVASLGEPFGRTTIEAMAAGKPVVATNSGASPEIVEDGVTGFLVPLGAPEKMADAIARIIQNPQLAQEMGRKGKARGKQFFSPESYVSGVTDVLAEAALIVKPPEVDLAALFSKLIALVPYGERAWFAGTAAGIVDMEQELPQDDNCQPPETSLLEENTRLREQLAETSCALEKAGSALQIVEGEIVDIKNSLSWRLTAPIRSLSAPIMAKLYKIRH